MQSDQNNQDQIQIEKSLPHNFLAEKMILNSLIANPDYIDRALKTLPIEAFYFKNHQEVYRALIFMYENNFTINNLTLTTFLQEKGQLEKIGGIKVLIELVNQIPSLIYFDDYLSLVKEKFLRRALIKFGYELITSGYTTNIPFEKILAESEKRLFNLTTEGLTQNLSTSTELLNSIVFDLKERALKPSLPGLASGFYDLDSLTQGFQKSDLIILAGRPSVGKTALSLNIALNVLKNSKLPILFFSLEMSKEQIMYRFLSIETGINQARLRSGQLSQLNWERLNKVVKVLVKLPIFVDDTATLSVSEIKSKIKTVIFEQSKIGLVIIDYLQLMQSSRTKLDNPVQELSEITRSLKILAREFNIPILTLSQLNRNVENRVDKKPVLSDLRASGSIEQDADLVLMLSKDPSKSLPTSTETMTLVIAKQRNGPTGNLNLKFDPNGTKFYDFE